MLEKFLPWLRIVVGLDLIALPWLKRILQEKLGAPEDGKKLYKYLEEYQAKFEEEGIKPSQTEKLFPKDEAKTDETKFDITLYGFIIRTIAKHTQTNIQEDIKVVNSIVNFRNRMKHMGNKKMNEQEFKKQWKEIVTFFHQNGFNVNVISSLKSDVLLSPKYVESVIVFLLEGNVSFLVFK